MEESLEYLASGATGPDVAANYYEQANIYMNNIEKYPGGAFLWMDRAAFSGHVEAMKEVSKMYDNGIGVVRNPGMANYWYTRAFVIDKN